MYRCGSWTIKEVEHGRVDVFELWCWRRLFRVPWTARRSNQSILTEINLEKSLEGLMLKLEFQLSHLYMTTGKIIALTIQTFVIKVMSLLFNTLSRFVIAFLPRRKHLLISWLQSPSTVSLESKKMKSVTVFILSPSICEKRWHRMP